MFQRPVRHLVYAGLRSTGLPAVMRRSRNRGVILAYHNVVLAAPGDGEPALHLRLEDFARQMAWLRRHYECVTLSTLVARMARGDPLRRTVAVTFDDGYHGVVAHALPLLRTLDIPATVFVVSRAVGDDGGFWWDDPALATASPEQRTRWLHECAGDAATIRAHLTDPPPTHRPRDLRAAEWNDLRAAARHGVELGAHTRTHRALTALDAASILHEVEGCATDLLERTGTRPGSFAYPYGLWDARSRSAAQAAGFRAAVTTQMGLVGAHDDPLTLARISVPAGLPQATFENWLAGVRIRGRNR